ncbi:hypothetical protein WH47_06428 [Habropoda laboriosa]|uniref:Uncharacterized protein n=1 Tax=Habropoda laboriosa TaxID=597456 RepID=A0A0L7RCZ7_9HYME|nr:hypothetical protein WH47_06428 [Habropoda laboriosa]
MSVLCEGQERCSEVNSVMKLRKLLPAEDCRACEDSGYKVNRLTKVSIKTNGLLLIAFLREKENHACRRNDEREDPFYAQQRVITDAILQR